MRKVGDMTLYSFDEVVDEMIGAVGTPDRDQFEHDVDEALHAYEIGEAIKKARLEQHLTQEELGEKIGVKKARISRLERGNSITLTSLMRVCRALGLPTTIKIGNIGEVALC